MELVSDGDISVDAAVYAVNGIFGNTETVDELILSTEKIDTVTGAETVVAVTSFAENFNPDDVELTVTDGSGNVRAEKSGGFIPGIRPGKPTSDYLNNILNYIVLIGVCGLIVVCLIPIIISGLFTVNQLSFGGTSLIIIVGVVLETIKAVESQMLVRNYKGFLND